MKLTTCSIGNYSNYHVTSIAEVMFLKIISQAKYNIILNQNYVAVTENSIIFRKQFINLMGGCNVSTKKY